MDRKLKRILMLAAAMIFISVTMIATSITAFAADEDKYIWAIGYEGEHGNISVDTENYYKDSRYSIKITNKDFNSSYITKTVTVEPHTTYKFSAMVKYSGYKLIPDAKRESTGALLSAKLPGTAVYNGNTSRFNGKKWTKLELEFTTLEEQTEVELMLWNGDQSAHCKGTAWFSDIKLEKCDLTNKWNILTLIYKNVDTKVKLNNETITVDHSLNSTDTGKIKKELQNFNKWINDNAKGLMSINDIDVATIDTPVTKLVPYNINDDPDMPGYNGGYRIDDHADYVKKYVNKFSDTKKYHHIFVVVPLGGVTVCWSGATGMYDSTTGFSQILYEAKSFNAADFMSTYIHEMLHVVNIHSLKYDPDTLYLHSYLDDGKQYTTAELDKWYAKYMGSKLPGGKGADPRAYWLPSGKCTLIDDDMTAGGLVDTSALSLKLSDATLKKIKNQTYTGKAVKPDVTLTDGKYTLKKGIDYTLSYKNNTKIGTASVTIKGKGIYTGTRTLNFKIVPGKSTLKASKISNTKVKLTWNKVKNAEKYEIYYSTNGGKYKKLATVSNSKTSYTNSKLNFEKNDYKFTIRAYDKVNGKTYYGSYSKAVSAK